MTAATPDASEPAGAQGVPWTDPSLHARQLLQQGFALHNAMQFREAIVVYEQVLAINPRHFDALHLSGVAAFQLKEFERAKLLISQALSINPYMAEAQSNYGAALQELGLWDKAVMHFNDAIMLKPDYAEAMFNRGNAYKSLNRFQDAIDSYNQAITMNPCYGQAFVGRGLAQLSLMQSLQARESYEQALAIDPHDADAHWNLGLCCLLLGDFEKGWTQYEWRWRNTKLHLSPRFTEHPLWLGQDTIKGKTILLHSEQGYGDTVQFSRYVKKVANLGARVIFEVQAPLLKLLSKTKGASQVIAAGESLPPFDYQCPLMSLPLAFKTRLDSIPPLGELIKPPAQKVAAWRAKLGVAKLPRVGVIWSGSTTHANDRNRSLSLAEFVKGLPEHCEYFCLQKEIRDQDRPLLDALPQLQHFENEFDDFTDTAALGSLMDLVISVDSGMAHLAAAMGKPVWVLLPYYPDWRWLQAREDNPWYPSIKIYRQQQPTDGWPQVMARVSEDLVKLPKAKPMSDTARASALKFRFATAYKLQTEQQDFATAQALYELILQVQPLHFDVLQLLGLVHYHFQRYALAIDYISQALAIQPEFANGYQNRGLAYQVLEQREAAVADFEALVRLRPDYADGHFNLGCALRDCLRFESAIACYDKAIALNPGHIKAKLNRATALQMLNRMADAVAAYKEISNDESERVHANWNLSLCALALGDFETGWDYFEWRWQNPKLHLSPRTMTSPPWLGQRTLQGKTILLHAEQGLGDTMQFCRYAKLVADLGAKVILEVQRPLQYLLQNVEGVSQLIVQGDPTPAHDEHCPLMSLPLAFKTRLETIPAPRRYLSAPVDKVKHWQTRLGEKHMPRVGVVWSGNAIHKNDRSRSVALEEFLSHLPAGYQYISLQKEVRAYDEGALKSRDDFLHFGNALGDFSDTAALCESVDWVISVDTSVAHMAAALGKHVALLLPSNADWRWLMGRVDSPWYPTMSLYQKNHPDEDWTRVLTQVRADMQSQLAGLASDVPVPSASASDQLFDHALAIHQQGDYVQAEALYLQVLQGNPQHLDALHLLGVMALQTKHYERVSGWMDKIFSQTTQFADAYKTLSIAQRNLDQSQLALESIDRFIALKPHSEEGYFHRGNALHGLARYSEAVASYVQAIALKSDYADAYYNQGMALHKSKQFQAAIISYDQALALRSTYPEAHHNRGMAWQELHQFDESMRCYDQAIAQAPDFADAHWSACLCALSLGNFERGWKGYEWRWRNPQLHLRPRTTDKPLWLGDADLNGKNILLHAEQGIGDTLQFCRYTAQVAALGAIVLLEVQAPLKNLLCRLEGVHQIFAQGETIPPFDYHCPLMSLPLAFQTRMDTIPAPRHYLTASNEKIAQWKKTLGVTKVPRIGLVWSGNAIHKNDQNRSMSLAQLLASLPSGAQYISLQKELRASDVVTLKSHPEFVHLGDALQDFSDTAALCTLVDLVISVDTSVAHLAAGLGKDVWLLLPSNADWRWLQDVRESPWYPSMRLYRQVPPVYDLAQPLAIATLNPTADAWAKVLSLVHDDLVSAFSLTDHIDAVRRNAPSPAPIKSIMPTANLSHTVTAIKVSSPPNRPADDQPSDGGGTTSSTSNETVSTSSISASEVSQRFNQALALHQQGHYEQALPMYEQVLQDNPRHLDALHLLGVMAVQQRKYGLVPALMDNLFAVSIDFPEAYKTLGIALRHMGKNQEALENFERYIALKPQSHEGYFHRGNALLGLSKNEEAIASFKASLERHPNDADALYNLGLAYQADKQYASAVDCFDQCIANNAAFVGGHYNKGLSHLNAKQPLQAIASFDTVIALIPENHEAYTHRGNALMELKRYEEAIASYEQVMRIDENIPEAYYNKALALQRLGRNPEALANYNRALEIKPDYGSAWWNSSICCLTMGDFETGWERYEWRWRNNLGIFPRPTPPALWLGDAPLQGKTIVLHAEQGLGDAIQFSRYVKMVADLGAKVILDVHPPLLELMTRLAGPSQIIPMGSAQPEHDYQCPLLSLPLAFKTRLETIPNPGRYLSASPEKLAQWQAILGEKTKPRIGLVWSGNKIYKNDQDRSISFEQFAPVLPPHCQCIALQKEIKDEDLATLQQFPDVLHFEQRIETMSDTAALCDLMDLIITVDTGVAHLAGALGRPVWIMLPVISDWRWLQHRSDSPWYPSAKLYRQKTRSEGWREVIRQVQQDAQTYFSNSTGPLPVLS